MSNLNPSPNIPYWNSGETTIDPEKRGFEIAPGSISSIQIENIATFLDDTAGGTDAMTTKAPTSNVLYDHAVATTGVHGAGTSTIASAADITTHANLTATHGAGTIASIAAATALITTHANSTNTHGAGTIAAVADIANHAALTAGVHGLSGTVDVRIDDVINTGDATTDGVIDAMRDFLIARGWITPA
jgi:hypothetical protein